MRPTYFAFDPKVHTQEQAFNLARLFLASDSVIYVSASTVMGRIIDRTVGVQCILEGWTLIQVSPDGTQLKI